MFLRDGVSSLLGAPLTPRFSSSHLKRFLVVEFSSRLSKDFATDLDVAIEFGVQESYFDRLFSYRLIASERMANTP